MAAALNEQGFLFAQMLRSHITFDRPGRGSPQQQWQCLASEYAVTAPDGSQTRIDLVLRHQKHRGNFACVECKRAHPQYKQWIFFDRERGSGGQEAPNIFLESLNATKRPPVEGSSALHGMTRSACPSSCLVFNLYLEVAIDRQRKASHTDTMEEAFVQVTRGQAGFMAKQLGFTGEPYLTAIPVVVTTAQLFEARFDEAAVSLDTGMIQPVDLKLTPVDFCAVNYHANDSLAVRSPFSPPCQSIEDDIAYWQARTVFVVQSNAVSRFLDWLGTHVAIH